MTRKQLPNDDLPANPLGDTLADVYLFLLRKAIDRKRAVTAIPSTDTIADTSPDQTQTTVSDIQTSVVRPDVAPDSAQSTC